MAPTAHFEGASQTTPDVLGYVPDTIREGVFWEEMRVSAPFIAEKQKESNEGQPYEYFGMDIGSTAVEAAMKAPAIHT